ncbi:hypothetical protein [Umezawaea tangerina]|nr:hypothetical protein [Umezawaea tangerina]
MPDEIDQHFDSIQREQQRLQAWTAWTSKYTVHRHSAIERWPLTPYNGPYLDLVTNFVTRALAAGMGRQALLMRGPHNELHAASLLEPSVASIATPLGKIDHAWWKPQRLQYREWKRILWAQRADLAKDVEQVNRDLRLAGRAATLLEMPVDTAGECSRNAHLCVSDSELYVHYYGTVPRWADRDTFAAVCARTLLDAQKHRNSA